MLMRFIWKPDTLVNMAERLVWPVAFSRTLGGMVGKVWKCSGRFTSFTACQSGSHEGCHMGSMSHEQDLLHRSADVPVGQAGEADLPVGIVAAEVDQPVVVDAEHFARRLVIVQPRGRAQDAEDDLGLDAIAIHVLDAQLGRGGTGNTLLTVLVEPGRGHHV